ncbi:MAG: 6-pyruvoyl-tetrahydropterin synthase-related protein, partial [Lachnospiraceae bacterium]
MSFKGYKLKAKLYAAHSNIAGNVENTHFHTFTIVLYLKDLNEDMDFFFHTEKEINEWLAPYQNKELSNTELFRGKSTTLEAIGDTFYDEWVERAKALNFELIRLDIYENPIRTYSVSDKMLDADVNEISAMPYAFTDTIEHVEEDGYIREAAATVQEEAEQPACEAGAVTDAETDVPEKDREENGTEEEKEERKENGKENRKSAGERSFLLALKLIGAILLFGAVAAAILYSMMISGNYPQGSDTLCHLYRADVLLSSIKEGVFYPLYDKMWYNGVEIMRYWAPIPLYILAALEAAAGSVLGGYLLFVASVFLIGAIGWLLLGVKLNRIGLSVFVGIIWFFLPENMRLIILDGNLPRVVINTAMPFLLLAVWNVIEEKRWKHIIPLTFLIAFIGLCHIGIALMAVATLVIFLCFYGKKNHAWREVRMVLVSVVIGLLLTGIWLVPSLHGSGAGNSAGGNQVMQYFFESAFVSLNPVSRWNGNLTVFYYGLSVLVISVFGLFLGTKKTLPGFATGVIIFICTTKSVYQLFEKLPFSQFLWMIRFVTISMAFVMLSLLLWKGLKRYVVLIICGLLVVDCLPSYRYIYEEKENRVADVSANQYALGERLLFNKAKELTTQRMAVFDLSTYGAFAPYYVAGVEKKVPYTFGAGWEGARTARNIVMLNGAIEGGHYAYVFDRSIELGTDTLVFDVTVLKNRENDVENLVAEGKRQGYELIERTEKNLLFHRETQECFGVVSRYENIAIGKAATDIAMLYPSFKEGTSENLSDYTVEELSGYQRIYLSDFTYKDKAQAEE